MTDGSDCSHTRKLCVDAVAVQEVAAKHERVLWRVHRVDPACRSHVAQIREEMEMSDAHALRIMTAVCLSVRALKPEGSFLPSTEQSHERVHARTTKSHHLPSVCLSLASEVAARVY